MRQVWHRGERRARSWATGRPSASHSPPPTAASTTAKRGQPGRAARGRSARAADRCRAPARASAVPAGRGARLGDQCAHRHQRARDDRRGRRQLDGLGAEVIDGAGARGSGRGARPQAPRSRAVGSASMARTSAAASGKRAARIMQASSRAITAAAGRDAALDEVGGRHYCWWAASSLATGGGGERRLTSRHLARDAAERVQIGAVIDRAAAALLGRHVRRRAPAPSPRAWSGPPAGARAATPKSRKLRARRRWTSSSRIKERCRAWIAVDDLRAMIGGVEGAIAIERTIGHQASSGRRPAIARGQRLAGEAPSRCRRRRWRRSRSRESRRCRGGGSRSRRAPR